MGCLANRCIYILVALTPCRAGCFERYVEFERDGGARVWACSSCTSLDAAQRCAFEFAPDGGVSVPLFVFCFARENSCGSCRKICALVVGRNAGPVQLTFETVNAIDAMCLIQSDLAEPITDMGVSDHLFAYILGQILAPSHVRASVHVVLW